MQEKQNPFDTHDRDQDDYIQDPEDWDLDDWEDLIPDGADDETPDEPYYDPYEELDL